MASRPENSTKKKGKKTKKPDAEAVDKLLDELEESLDDLEQEILEVRDQKETMFEEMATKIQLQVQVGNTDAFDAAFGARRLALIEQIKQHRQALFDSLPDDADQFFNIKAATSRSRLRSHGRIPVFAIEEYLAKKALNFAANTSMECKKAGDLFGTVRWTNNLTSFDCLKLLGMGFVSRENFEAKSSFVFLGRRVQVRHDPDKTSRHLKHHYLFDLCDANNNVRSSVPFELEYDMFTAPTAIYCYGPRMLLVTSFYKMKTNLIFKMLKQHDTLGQMPEAKPTGYYNAYFFALFDASCRLRKTFMTSEQRKIGCYAIAVDLLNERGIVLTKRFESMRVPGTQNYNTCYKRLVTFYDYNFQPVFQDLQLPNSSAISNVVKVDDNLVHYVCLDTQDSRRIDYKVFDLNTETVVSDKTVPRRSNPYIRPTKYLLDSKNNLYIIQKAHFVYRSVVKTHGYFVGCVNVDTHEWHEIDPPSDSVFYRGAYLNENDQMVIVSKPEPGRRLIFNTFGF